MAKSFYTTGTGNEQTLTPIINEKVPIYDTVADAEADLANLEVGQIVKTKDAGLVANLNPIDEVKQGVFLPPTSNAVAKCLSYSTTETFTGEVWIDGNGVEHKIYRKVVTGTITGNGIFTISTGLSSFVCWSLNGGLLDANGAFSPVPYVWYSGINSNITIYIQSNGEIKLGLGSDYSGTRTYRITIKYIKNE